MIAEDDPVARTLMTALLEGAGYSVVAAANGREALALLHRGPLPVLILLDMKMPVMSGREFRQEQQRDATLARIPVVILSGDGDGAAAESLGAAANFPKPIDPDRLLAVLHTLAPCRTE
jgi:CheY-like chemotaxis protein